MLKNNVLRKEKDFSAIYKKGKSVGDRYIVLFYRNNRLGYNRTGFLASKKVGTLPLYSRLTDEEVEYIIKTSQDVLKEYRI